MSEINRNPVLLTNGGIPRKGYLAHWFCDIVYNDHLVGIISLIYDHGYKQK